MTTTYSNFDLLITAGDHGYLARVIASPVGESAAAMFRLPFDEQELHGFFWLSGRLLRTLSSTAPTLARRQPLTPEAFGARLYAAIFSGGIANLLRRSLDAVERDGEGLRIRLRMNDVPELADLPWEFLYAPDLARFPALSAGSPIVRYVEQDRPLPTLETSPPLTLLALIANPGGDFEPLNVEQEWTNLQQALADAERSGRIHAERLPSPTLDALQDRLRKGAVHIIHFIGHGYFDDDADEGGLVLEAEEGGGRLVTAPRLAMMLRDHDPLHLIFLNACEGARGGRTDPFGGVAQKLVQQGIPAVLAMQFEISDRAAVTLSHEFYEAIADGLPVDAAVVEARKAVYATGNEREWGTPVLFSRSPDNRLFAPIPADGLADFESLPFEPESVAIPAGAFFMGSDPGEGIPMDETPQHRVTLPGFRLGKTPVTNAQYAEFLKRAKGQEEPRRAGWFLRQPPPDQLEHPVVGISWHDAMAYCHWLSSESGRRYRLPTEAEWEKASRGSEGSIYPWGNFWENGRCNTDSDGPTRVDAYPDGASPYGCLDMLGNVEEWTLTVWGDDSNRPGFAYPYRLDDGRDDPDADRYRPGLHRVVRGGSYREDGTNLRCARRVPSPPDSKLRWRGFRVAMVS
ncbi:MAG: SUMF1/EgtB/PvdO family nonheme iron enzyme [Caldilineaceae bacterium]|nr:SUMF1/EgtB/PvdO family nonheme iron enzyme [Caldilineaceae bacterium]